VIVRRPAHRLLPLALAFGLGLGVPFLAACGSSTNKAMIPASNADTLHQHLDAVQSAIDGGHCDKISSALLQLETDVQELPAGTSQRLTDRLNEGIDRLKVQAPKACSANTATTQSVPTVTTVIPTVTTTATVPTATVPTTTTPTTTVPTTTPTTTTPATTTSSDTGGVTTP
jgi:hypothetical protein